VEDRCAPVLLEREDLDAIHVLPRQSVRRAVRGRPWRLPSVTRDFRLGLQGARYDVAIDLQGNLKSGLVTRASGASLRLGYARGATKELNHLHTTRRWRPPTAPQHRIERYLGLVSALLGEALPYRAPGFPLSAAERRSAAELLAQRGLPPSGTALLHPGTSGFGSFKRWPPAHFGLLAQQLAERGWSVGVTVGPGEAALGEEVVRVSAGRATLLAPDGLRSLAALIETAGLFVAADTGPLHLASLLERPLLGLFGPKDPAIYGPYGETDGVPGVLPTIVRGDVACRPCRLRRCGDPLCMKTMTVEDVLAALPGGK
jgi:ADP-heptose:LPS heptosyltransferase